MHSLILNVFYRITEWLRLGGTSGCHWVQSPAQAGTHTAGCPGPGTDGF